MRYSIQEVIAPFRCHHRYENLDGDYICSVHKDSIECDEDVDFPDEYPLVNDDMIDEMIENLYLATMRLN